MNVVPEMPAGALLGGTSLWRLGEPPGPEHEEKGGIAGCSTRPGLGDPDRMVEQSVRD
ncbi:hypothetical protein ABZV31_35415 [Streptomyces sp. NPDC005202]|uniref:hypothetical protein n=1 Tax=Streptomyces sp. NPDC005202 TaxID=3157021 RepID=UPI0033BD52CD